MTFRRVLFVVLASPFLLIGMACAVIRVGYETMNELVERW